MRSLLSSALLAGGIAVCMGGHALADGPVMYNGYKPAKDAQGHPDLNGVWGYATITPFERFPQFGDRLIMSQQEADAAEGKVKAVNDLAAKPTDASASVKDLPADCSQNRGKSCNYNAGWTDPGTQVMRVAGKPRSSILTTPDGRVPANLKGDRPRLVLEGEEENYTPQPGQAPADPPGMNDNPETRSNSERCLSYGRTVLRSSTYNNNIAIQQGGDTVGIWLEMIHDMRFVRLNAKHGAVPMWGGDSIGWYDGPTLVVETTLFNSKESNFYGASDQLKVTERYTRVSPTKLHYAFSIEDPKTWAKPWGGEEELTATPQIYEYACHEGNYGLENILAGARAEEASAALKRADTGK